MESDFSLGHEGQDSFACARSGQGFAPNLLALLLTSRARWCAISSPTAYLRPLKRDLRTCSFSAATYVLPPKAKNTTCGLLLSGAIAPTCCSGIIAAYR